MFFHEKILPDVSRIYLVQHLREKPLSMVKLQLFPGVHLWIRFFQSSVFETALYIVLAQSFKWIVLWAGLFTKRNTAVHLLWVAAATKRCPCCRKR